MPRTFCMGLKGNVFGLKITFVFDVSNILVLVIQVCKLVWQNTGDIAFMSIVTCVLLI